MERILMVVFLLIALAFAVFQTSAQDVAPTTARENLVRSLGAQGISDERVLAAIGEVPRERFVPERLRNHAYDDRALPIGEGQTISQPFVVAYMTQMLHVDSESRVLEIGTGSGYQAAILSGLVADVYSIEIVEPLGRRAAELLTELGYGNVHVRIGDGYQGWPEEAPFDAIIVTAAPGHIPAPLVDQLAVGGTMVLPVGDSTQFLTLVERSDAGVTTTRDLPVIFVPMTGEAESR